MNIFVDIVQQHDLQKPYLKTVHRPVNNETS